MRLNNKNILELSKLLDELGSSPNSISIDIIINKSIIKTYITEHENFKQEIIKTFGVKDENGNQKYIQRETGYGIDYGDNMLQAAKTMEEYHNIEHEIMLKVFNTARVMEAINNKEISANNVSKLIDLVLIILPE